MHAYAVYFTLHICSLTLQLKAVHHDMDAISKIIF